MSEHERRLVQYLLGQTSTAEREEIEERVFTDDEAEEELQATADDLIHAYLAGGLSEQERGQFESHFLGMPHNRRRLDFIRNLLTAVERLPAAKAPPADTTRASRVWAWAAAAALLIAVGAIVVPRRGPEPVPEAALPSVAQTLPPVLPTPSPSSTPAPVRLAASVRHLRLPRRPAGAVEMALAGDTRVVRVEVHVDDSIPSFDASLHDAAGREVWRAETLVAEGDGSTLAFDVPARAFASAERYALRIEAEPLRGASPTDRPFVLEYPLRVRREP
jgi:hypothetical protein